MSLFSFFFYFFHPLKRLMLRNLSRTINFNKKYTRAFHDCPTNSIQPLRLLLIGCPVSLHKREKKKKIMTERYFRALEKEPNLVD